MFWSDFSTNRARAALRIMLHVHQNGVGVCGVFTYEVAETKVAQVIETARTAPAPAAVHHGKGLRGTQFAIIFAESRRVPAPRGQAFANQRKHEYATLEHLLLALIDDADAAAVMKACEVDLAVLKKNLGQYVDNDLKSLVVDDGEDAKPTAGFQRVIQRAVIHVQSSAGGTTSPAPMCWSRSSPSARATPPISCSSRR